MMTPVRPLRLQSGMGLVEIMVGLVIGLIGVLVIFQTTATWGGRTATTMSGGDAQTAGAVGSFYLEREIKQAGWGFGVAGAPEGGNNMGCTVAGYTLSPVVIADGGDDPDSITVLYGTSPIFSAAAAFKEGTASQIQTDSWGGFKAGDQVVLGSGASCRLATVGTTPSRNLPITITTGGSALPSGFAYNMGAAIVRARWEVNTVDGGLRWGDNAATENIFPVADGVVDLQAQYGFDSDGDLRTGDITWQDPSDPVTNWNLLKAIRFAILVRGKNYEKPVGGCPATPKRPTWFGNNFTMHNLDAARTKNDTDVTTCNAAINVNDWHQYRYEVFERVVPLRNVMWGGIGE